ncbi:hypothetical protein Ancab_007041 [Ancistrocladus abbreviatus]
MAQNFRSRLKSPIQSGGIAMKGGKLKVESKTSDSKLSVKKGTAKGTKKGKATKDPNAPKKLATVFFFFIFPICSSAKILV